MNINQSSCGHVESPGGECSIMCDDYVFSSEGYCYLSAFNLSMRMEVKSQLGMYPYSISFNRVYIDNEQSQSAFVTPPLGEEGILHVQTESIASQQPTVVHLGECSGCRFSFKSYSNSLRPKRSTPCPRDCNLSGNTYKETSMIRFSYFANKVGSKVSARNLLLKEPASTGFEFREPRTYVSESNITLRERNAEYDEESGLVRLWVNDDDVSYNINDQKLKAFTHDYVSSCWKDKTDALLSSLGIEGPAGLMTPDFIITETKCVLEIATCGTDNQRVIESSYDDKRKKYHDELERVGAKFFILVVSPQKVMTNLDINQDFVDTLTQRMRLVMPLKQRLIEILGVDITDNEFSEMERIVKSSFSSASIVDCPEINEKYKYDLNEIRECSTPLTSSESTSAARILLKMYESTRTTHTSSKKDLDDYLEKFTSDNSRVDQKRICNLPFLLPGIDTGDFDPKLDGPDSLRQVWEDVIANRKPSPKELTVKDIEEDKDVEVKHMTKRQMLVKTKLSASAKAELALSGVGGKAFKHDEEVEKHRETSKLSFHPNVPTEDIDDFSQRDLLHNDNTPNKFLSYTLKTAVEKSKAISCPEGDNRSLEVWMNLMNTDLMKYSMMMTRLFFELAYTYKHWTFHYEFLIKDMGNGIKALIYNPKSTIFVSFAFPKHGMKLWDRGRIGPSLYTSSTHIFTDWSSFDNSQLEHFMKFGPYMGSCLVELMNSSDSSSEDYSRYTRECAPHLLMLYCNNKTDAEELVSSQRYLFMKLLEDVGTSPYIFVDRFPKVLRSRLTAYYLKKTISMMDYYSTVKISKVPRQGEDMILYDYMNIKSLFSKNFVSLSTKINEFYFGYVVSKERNTGKDKTFKVLTKLIKQEQKFRANVKGSIFTRGEDYEEFKTNMPLIKFFSGAFSDLLVGKFGKDYKEKIMNDFVFSASRVNFSDLATLKVSSRDHTKDVEVPLGSDSTEEVFEKLKKEFPDEILKRPFCMESMTSIIKQYKEDKGKDIEHISQLAPWCLKKLIEKGYFDSDQFDKSQHCGEREIHVLEFMARIVQYFLELISRTICSYFPSETTVNPDTKDRFVKEHYAKSKEMFGDNFTTVSKSADATTWCQFHHTSHLAAMFQAILPDELKEFSLSALSLWPRKRLSFPLKQASSLAANVKLQTSNSVYMKFKSDFEKGEGMFLSARSNLIEVISGMFQGILHTSSSLYHTMIQEVMKQVMIHACKGRLGLSKVLITVVQGSDDSGCMISVPGKPSMKIFQLLKRLLLWKERVSPYLSVFCNEAKSSIGTHDLIEYNSEWHVRHMIIKPTFRWVSACQELSVTERFIDRFRIYNNMITDCLTGGASSLECSVIQLFQATMHYTLMGLSSLKNEDARIRYLELIVENPDPLHGFFPMDEDISCGVTGVEFLLYRLYKNTSFGKNLRVLGDSETLMDYSPEDLPSWMKTKDMSSVRLKFSKMSVFYRVLERMNIEPLEDAVKAVEDDPAILFSRSNGWSDEQHNLVLKVFSTGVKESISNKSSMLRMAASSAYILSGKCFSSSEDRDLEEVVIKKEDGSNKTIKQGKKHTLLSLMVKHGDNIRFMTKNDKDKERLFPYHEEYEKLLSDILNLKLNGKIIQQMVKRTSKVKLVIIPKPVGESDVIDMCIRKWFDRGVPSLSQGQFNRKWKELEEKFSFLDGTRGVEGIRETSKNLGLNVVQTKSFLESMSARSRSIVLYDSSSRGGSLSYSLSRIYWPNTKLIVSESSVEDKIGELRSRLFSAMTFWYDHEQTTNICKDLVKYCHQLSESYTKIPAHGMRLKIMNDVLNGENNFNLIHRIEDSRKGLIGSFVQQQKGRGSSRKGLGIWQGSICGISTKINMLDNVCNFITVNALYDTVTLGWHLNQFMNESSLTMPKPDNKAKDSTNCWLTNEGKIVISRDRRGIPIYQDTKLRMIGTNETANMKWQVDVNNNNMRLRARDPTTGQLTTILSETITNSDWIPNLSTDTDDPIFNKWSRGESMFVPNLDSILTNDFPMSRYEFMRQKDKFNNGKLVNGMHWSFKRFQETLRNSIVNRGYKKDEEKKLSKDDQTSIDSDVLNRFSLMMGSLADKFEDDLDKEIEDWAAEVEMEEESINNLWGIDMDQEDDEAIERNMSLFSTVENSSFYELVDRNDLTKNFSMPSASRFFSPLEHVNIAIHNESLRKSILAGRKAPGMMGIIFTIVNGEYSIGKDDDMTSEVIELEEEISSVSSTMSRPGALNNLSLEEVRIHIVNLQDQLDNNTRKYTKRVRKLLNLYKDREEEIMKRIDPNTQDIIMLNSNSIISQLMTFFSEQRKLPVDISQLEDDMKRNLFSTMVRTHVSKLEDISKSEKDELSLHLSTNSISRGSLQTLSAAYSFNIRLDGDIVNIMDKDLVYLDLVITDDIKTPTNELPSRFSY